MRLFAILLLAQAAATNVAAQDRSPAAEERRPAAAPVTVGSKQFTESVILGELARQAIEAAGAPAVHRNELGGTRFLWSALLTGDIDIYPEYTGTIILEILAGESATDLEHSLIAYGIGITEPLGFNNTYALGMKLADADSLRIDTISDLNEHPGLTLAFSNEFMDRADGWPGLRAHYGLPHGNVRGIDHDLAYRGLESGFIDVTDLYSTDAEIQYYNLKVLRDDRLFFPKYEAVYLYRLDLLQRSPEAVEALARIKISEDQMIEMNARAKVSRVSEYEIAQGFLEGELGIESSVTRGAPS